LEKHKSPFLVDEQKRKSQDVEGSSLEQKTKMFSNVRANEFIFRTLETKKLWGTNGIF